MADGVKGRGRGRAEPMTLAGLRAADAAEYGPAAKRVWQRVPHLSAAEQRVFERYARLVRDGRYANAVLAVADCRRELARLPGSRPAVRTRQAVHVRLVKVAIHLGRVRTRARWLPEETAMLDRFARAVALGRIRTARAAGPPCQAAITALHRRFPKRYDGIPKRSLTTIQRELWPRVAKLRFRWHNSHWAKEELALVDRYAAAVVKHRFPHIRAASRACCAALDRLHRRHGSAGGVRTLAAVFDQIFDRTRELDTTQLAYRRWTTTERKAARRWMLKYDRHMRGKSQMNLLTTAEMLRAELGRLGFYRNQQACISEIVTQRSAMLGRPARRSPSIRRGPVFQHPV